MDYGSAVEKYFYTSEKSGPQIKRKYLTWLSAHI